MNKRKLRLVLIAAIILVFVIVIEVTGVLAREEPVNTEGMEISPAHPPAQDCDWCPSGSLAIDCPPHFGCEGLKQFVLDAKENCLSSEHLVWNSANELISHVRVDRSEVEGVCIETKTIFK